MTFERRAAQVRDEMQSRGEPICMPTVEDVAESLQRNPRRPKAVASLRAMARTVGDLRCSLWAEALPLLECADEMVELYDSSGLDDPPCPVRLLLQGYIETHPPVETRAVEKPGMLMPSRLGQSESDPRRYSVRPVSTSAQIELPGFERKSRKRGGMLPIEIFLLDQMQVKAGGPAAPISQRLFITGLALAPMKIPPTGVIFEKAARAVFDMLYPVGQRRFGRWLPQIEKAAVELYERGWVPYQDSGTGHTLKIQPVVINLIPTESVMDPIRFLVSMPRESESGPMVSPRLLEYGQNHARAFNTMLQLAYHWHAPGVTIIPIKGTSRWTRTYTWDRYEPYDRNEIIDLTAPLSESPKRNAFIRAMETIRWLETEGEIDVLEVGTKEYKIRPHQPEHGQTS